MSDKVEVHLALGAETVRVGTAFFHRRRQGLSILEELRRKWPDLPVVLTTAREEGICAAALSTAAPPSEWPISMSGGMPLSASQRAAACRSAG